MCVPLRERLALGQDRKEDSWGLCLPPGTVWKSIAALSTSCSPIHRFLIMSLLVLQLWEAGEASALQVYAAPDGPYWTADPRLLW